MPHMQSVFTRTLRPFIMLNVACDTCGMIRVAIELLQMRRTATNPARPREPLWRTCPLCGLPAPAEQIGSGETVRPLPFFEPAGNYLPQAISGTYTNEANSKSLRPGTLVSYSEETGVYQFATIQEIVVQREAWFNPAR
jgi:hypothetical protein